jgi:hypothetical protein
LWPLNSGCSLTSLRSSRTCSSVLAIITLKTLESL